MYHWKVLPDDNVNNNFEVSLITDISLQIEALQEIERTHGPMDITRLRNILSTITFSPRSGRSATIPILMDFVERNFSYPDNEFIDDENENNDNGSMS
ncbi:MAG: hypothetical protein WCI84_11400 [Bacteroidota bacterium]